MPTAEIITIGTEILLGEIVDTNARYLARRLRDVGIDLFRKTTVGDNTARIALEIQQAFSRCDIVLTTGGLGPTVDDPTREAVAQAFGVALDFHPELWDQIQARFQRYNRVPTENNKRQAYVPHGATPGENPVGTAPIFFVEKERQVLIALPGVPREMEYLMEHTVIPYLRSRYALTGMIKARVVHTAGVGESVIDDLIGDLETLSNPTVGLAAHSGQVDVRITAKGASEAEAEALIVPVEAELHRLLGKWIYGVDEETLETAALRAVSQKGWSLVVVEAGLGGELTHHLAAELGPFQGGQVLAPIPTLPELSSQVELFKQAKGAQVGLGVTLLPAGERQDAHFLLITPEGRQEFFRPYGGPPENAARWALHHSLDIIRNL